ncbi:MAG: hypothetical protein NZ108_07515, partial [Bacteroidia bacterium]|nr:hypothetical protein [Bacteroidia bacterium]
MNKSKIFTSFIVWLFFVIGQNVKGQQRIAAGWSHTAFLCQNGSYLNTWGANSFGQLGIGNNSNQNLPVKLDNFSGAYTIAAGYQHTLVLRIDSTVWAWGDNTDGQLGTGNNTSSNVPVQISGLNSVIAISGGSAGYHSIALKSDGTVWTWGRNTDGQLGHGDNTNKNVPTQVPGLSNIIAIAGG